MNKEIFLACDFETKEELFAFLKKINQSNLILKIGLQMFLKYGPSLINELKEYKIFLDLKLYDIPNTVKEAINSIKGLMNVKYLTINLFTGGNTLKELPENHIKYLGVTVLTSNDENDLKILGINKSLKTEVINLAILAKKYKLYGVISSVDEVKLIKAKFPSLKVICPGIRNESAKNDQKRVFTALDAHNSNCDGIVLGREITKSNDPAVILQKITNDFFGFKKKFIFDKTILKNPIMNSSGTFGYGLEFQSILDLNRLGLLVTKSTTLEPKKGNPLPHIYFDKNFILNSIGLKNPGIEMVKKRILTKLASKFPNVKILFSIWGANIEEFQEIINEIKNVKNIIGYEINISCPNVDDASVDFQTNFKLLGELITKIKSLTTKTIVVKLCPDEKTIYKCIKFLNKYDIYAITLCNSIKTRAVVNGINVLGTEYGGRSGKKNKDKILKIVKKASLTTNHKIIACGGIFEKKNINDYQNNGALFFQVGSANLVDMKYIKTILSHYENRTNE